MKRPKGGCLILILCLLFCFGCTGIDYDKMVTTTYYKPPVKHSSQQVIDRIKVEKINFSYSYTGDKQVQGINIAKDTEGNMAVSVNGVESKQMEIDGIVDGVIHGIKLLKGGTP